MSTVASTASCVGATTTAGTARRETGSSGETSPSTTPRRSAASVRISSPAGPDTRIAERRLSVIVCAACRIESSG